MGLLIHSFEYSDYSFSFSHEAFCDVGIQVDV